MTRINYLALALAVVAAFIASSLWYSPLVFGKAFLALSGVAPTAGPDPVRIACELVRTFALAYVIGRLFVLVRIPDWKSALSLGLLLWVGFPVVLLTGSMLWQDVPWRLAAIHSGDWLVKMLLIALILGMWRKTAPTPVTRSSL
jgi:Protein of unknown function (DUF1761)